MSSYLEAELRRKPAPAQKADSPDPRFWVPRPVYTRELPQVTGHYFTRLLSCPNNPPSVQWLQSGAPSLSQPEKWEYAFIPPAIDKPVLLLLCNEATSNEQRGNGA